MAAGGVSSGPVQQPQSFEAPNTIQGTRTEQTKQKILDDPKKTVQQKINWLATNTLTHTDFHAGIKELKAKQNIKEFGATNKASSVYTFFKNTFNPSKDMKLIKQKENELEGKIKKEQKQQQNLDKLPPEGKDSGPGWGRGWAE